jgi:methylthioribose-1-phosphate isomerase
MNEKQKDKSTKKEYKSPQQKLLHFFNKSRDKWKKKCRTAKYNLKLRQNKIRYLEKIKTEMKETIAELENELGQMKKKEMEYNKEIEQVKKNSLPKGRIQQ